MAHRCKVGTEVFDIKGGKALVNGSVVNIIKGRVMVGGEVKDILFSNPVTVVILDNSDGSLTSVVTQIKIDGTKYSEAGTWEFDKIEEISVETKAAKGKVYLNNVEVDNPYVFAPDSENVTITITESFNIYITTE